MACLILCVNWEEASEKAKERQTQDKYEIPSKGGKDHFLIAVENVDDECEDSCDSIVEDDIYYKTAD